MNVTIRKTAIALAVATLAVTPIAFAQSVDDPNLDADINHQHVVNEDWTLSTTVNDATNTLVNDTTNTNTTTNDIVLNDTTTNNTTNTNDTTNTDTTTNTLVNDTTNTATNTWNQDVSNVVANTDTTTNTSDTSYTDDTTNTTVNDTTNTATNTWNQDISNVVSNTDTTTNTSDTSYTSTENHALDTDVDLVIDAAALVRYNGEFNETVDSTTTNVTNNTVNNTSDSAYTSTVNESSNTVAEDINRVENVDSTISMEGNEHQTAVSLRKTLSLNSDINFSGDPEITGAIDIDSAAIAVVDGQQAISDNEGLNDLVTNDAHLTDDVASGASGNLTFNAAAGDNNMQENSASLSAADASFAFGMADAEVFVNQTGTANTTMNTGVTNSAAIGGNAFSAASGNIGVNVTSGNNNEQKNSLAASVATSAYAQSSISTNQASSGNSTSNLGHYERVDESMDVAMTGTASGTGSYSGTGSSYQMNNLYPESWGAETNGGDHISSPRLGHIDLDSDIQGAVDNPNRGVDENGVQIGGIAFDNDEDGIVEFLGEGALDIMLSGTVSNSYLVAVDATNTAALSGTAFSGASGNIGVNVAAGSGNLQANSLALAVAQPSAGGGGDGGGATPPGGG